MMKAERCEHTMLEEKTFRGRIRRKCVECYEPYRGSMDDYVILPDRMTNGAKTYIKIDDLHEFYAG